MITSKSNDLIKYIKNLNQKKFRDEASEYVIEGKKLVKEAIDEHIDIKKIIVCEEFFTEKIELSGYDVEYVSGNVFKYIADTESPQGILAIAKKRNLKKEDYGDVIFALDNIQDPGNLGTIIRTLDCAGINTLLLSNGMADAYNPKVIRSTMGAIYRVNVFNNIDLNLELKSLKNKGYEVIVTALDADADLFEYCFPKKVVIVIGNESNGVGEQLQKLANRRIKIPMKGKTESLNAGVAASLMAYEIFRKR